VHALVSPRDSVEEGDEIGDVVVGVSRLQPGREPMDGVDAVASHSACSPVAGSLMNETT
jgi:hypothetical protein